MSTRSSVEKKVERSGRREWAGFSSFLMLCSTAPVSRAY